MLRFLGPVHALRNHTLLHQVMCYYFTYVKEIYNIVLTFILPCKNLKPLTENQIVIKIDSTLSFFLVLCSQILVLDQANLHLVFT